MEVIQKEVASVVVPRVGAIIVAVPVPVIERSELGVAGQNGVNRGSVLRRRRG